MTFRKSLSKTRHLSLTLLASLMPACGSDTPAFQEKSMSAIPYEQLPAVVGTMSESDNFGDAVAAPEAVADVENVPTGEEQEPGLPAEPEQAPVIDKVSIEGTNQSHGLVVEVKESQLRFGAQTSISAWLDGEKLSDVSYAVKAPLGREAGKIIGSTYVSPSSGSEAYEVKITATSKAVPGQSATAVIKLEPVAQVFVGCTKDSRGFPIKTDVYPIPTDTDRLPDFSLFAKPTTTVCMQNFQVPNRAWSDGFPGHPELIEWFAIRAVSHLAVSKSGTYAFKLNADDGAKLYIDGQLVVDNDGLHAQTAMTGSAKLSAGDHELVMEYFQGPRFHIALELYWKTPGSSQYVYVPAAAFKP